MQIWTFFGSVRSSRNANLRPSVCSVQSVLELTIFLFPSQVNLRSVSGHTQVSSYFIGQTEPRILRLVKCLIRFTKIDATFDWGGEVEGGGAHHADDDRVVEEDHDGRCLEADSRLGSVLLGPKLLRGLSWFLRPGRSRSWNGRQCDNLLWWRVSGAWWG